MLTVYLQYVQMMNVEIQKMNRYRIVARCGFKASEVTTIWHYTNFVISRSTTPKLT